METICISSTLLLAGAVVGTMIAIVRDVWPVLTAEEQNALRGWLSARQAFSFQPSGAFNAALNKAWKEHVRRFPNSYKRLMLACLFIGMFVPLMLAPLFLWTSHG